MRHHRAIGWLTRMAGLGSECAGRDKPMSEPSRHFAACRALGHVGLVISITGVINSYLATSKANVQHFQTCIACHLSSYSIGSLAVDKHTTCAVTAEDASHG
ncbi:hypothetical protein GGI35DRAFT_308450 [Trichoderma velutinum]